MLRYTDSKKFAATPAQDESMKKPHEYRNEFVHFVPKGYTLIVGGLPKISLDCLAVARFLAFELLR